MRLNTETKEVYTKGFYVACYDLSLILDICSQDHVLPSTFLRQNRSALTADQGQRRYSTNENKSIIYSCSKAGSKAIYYPI